MENKDLHKLDIEELQELIENLEEENQMLKKEICDKKEELEDLLSIVE